MIALLDNTVLSNFAVIARPMLVWMALGEEAATDDARQMLAAIYGWFTEGFDTPDLQEARTLIEELAQ